MAWRIADSVERGEIDNRTRDRVKGKIWIFGMKHPVELELTGNPHRDLAGQYLRFVNPNPKPLPEHCQSFAHEQTGVVGDITAARKVKILDVEDGELEHYYKNKTPMPYHWGNCLYLEWYSARNGRVVIEATDYQLTVEPEATWRMSEEEEKNQQEANGRAMINFMNTMLEAVADEDTGEAEDDEDAPKSQAEAEADAEAARMDLLNDRIIERLERDENATAETYQRIVEEERERLRRERGEPNPEWELNPPPTEEQEIGEIVRIDAANADFEEAMAKEDEPGQLEPDPLFERCLQLGERVWDDIEAYGWLPDGAQEEHPVRALAGSIWSAAAKLAGALNGRELGWPPEPCFAGDPLVRLKKARGYLNDANAALEAVETEHLADTKWTQGLKQDLAQIRSGVLAKIAEIREVLSEDEDDFNDVPF